MNLNDNASLDKNHLSLVQLIGLHLFPGILMALAYSLLIRPAVKLGYPKVLVLGIIATAVLIPVELGIIYCFSKRRVGNTASLSSAIEYREKIPLKQYLIWVPALFIWAGMSFAATKGVSSFLLDRFFGWIPAWYIIDGNIADVSKVFLWAMFFSNLILTGILVPVVEELYFRGFLLPRMSWMGKSAPFVNTVLFTLYHFWSPWQIVSRVLGLTPMVYIVNSKKNIKIGIIVHCLMNIAGDALPVLFLIMK